ncbi:hypothetical protein BVX98_05680, partial [bacterium F11]
SGRGKLERGVNHMDPRDQAYDMFSAAGEEAYAYFAQIANNRNVALSVRREAAHRMADITQALGHFPAMMKRYDSKTGLYGVLPEFAEASYINVSRNVRNRPALMIARTTLAFSDNFLPNTSKAKKAGGAEDADKSALMDVGPSGAVEVRSDEGFLNGLKLGSLKDAKEGEGKKRRVLSYGQQVYLQVASAIFNWDEKERERHIADLKAGGMLDADYTYDENNKEESAKDFARQIRSSWLATGAQDKEFNWGRILTTAEEVYQFHQGEEPGTQGSPQVVDRNMFVDVVFEDDDEALFTYEQKKGGMMDKMPMMGKKDKKKSPKARVTARTRSLAWHYQGANAEESEAMKRVLEARKSGDHQAYMEAVAAFEAERDEQDSRHNFRANRGARLAYVSSVIKASQNSDLDARTKVAVARDLNSNELDIENAIAAQGCSVCMVGLPAQQLARVWRQRSSMPSVRQVDRADAVSFAAEANQAVQLLEAQGHTADARALQDFAQEVEELMSAVDQVAEEAETTNQDSVVQPATQSHPLAAAAREITEASRKAYERKLDGHYRVTGGFWTDRLVRNIGFFAKQIKNNPIMFFSPERRLKKIVENHVMTDFLARDGLPEGDHRGTAHDERALLGVLAFVGGLSADERKDAKKLLEKIHKLENRSNDQNSPLDGPRLLERISPIELLNILQDNTTFEDFLVSKEKQIISNQWRNRLKTLGTFTKYSFMLIPLVAWLGFGVGISTFPLWATIPMVVTTLALKTLTADIPKPWNFRNFGKGSLKKIKKLPEKTWKVLWSKKGLFGLMMVVNLSAFLYMWMGKDENSLMKLKDGVVDMPSNLFNSLSSGLSTLGDLLFSYPLLWVSFSDQIGGYIGKVGKGALGSVTPDTALLKAKYRWDDIKEEKEEGSPTMEDVIRSVHNDAKLTQDEKVEMIRLISILAEFDEDQAEFLYGKYRDEETRPHVIKAMGALEQARQTRKDELKAQQEEDDKVIDLEAKKAQLGPKSRENKKKIEKLDKEIEDRKEAVKGEQDPFSLGEIIKAIGGEEVENFEEILEVALVMEGFSPDEAKRLLEYREKNPKRFGNLLTTDLKDLKKELAEENEAKREQGLNDLAVTTAFRDDHKDRDEPVGSADIERWVDKNAESGEDKAALRRTIFHREAKSSSDLSDEEKDTLERNIRRVEVRVDRLSRTNEVKKRPSLSEMREALENRTVPSLLAGLFDPESAMGKAAKEIAESQEAALGKAHSALSEREEADDEKIGWFSDAAQTTINRSRVLSAADVADMPAEARNEFENDYYDAASVARAIVQHDIEGENREVLADLAGVSNSEVERDRAQHEWLYRVQTALPYDRNKFNETEPGQKWEVTKTKTDEDGNETQEVVGTVTHEVDGDIHRMTYRQNLEGDDAAPVITYEWDGEGHLQSVRIELGDNETQGVWVQDSEDSDYQRDTLRGDEDGIVLLTSPKSGSTISILKGSKDDDGNLNWENYVGEQQLPIPVGGVRETPTEAEAEVTDDGSARTTATDEDTTPDSDTTTGSRTSDSTPTDNTDTSSRRTDRRAESDQRPQEAPVDSQQDTRPTRTESLEDIMRRLSPAMDLIDEDTGPEQVYQRSTDLIQNPEIDQHRAMSPNRANFAVVRTPSGPQFLILNVEADGSLQWWLVERNQQGEAQARRATLAEYRDIARFYQVPVPPPSTGSSADGREASQPAPRGLRGMLGKVLAGAGVGVLVVALIAISGDASPVLKMSSSAGTPQTFASMGGSLSDSLPSILSISNVWLPVLLSLLAMGFLLVGKGGGPPPQNQELVPVEGQYGAFMMDDERYVLDDSVLNYRPTSQTAEGQVQLQYDVVQTPDGPVTQVSVVGSVVVPAIPAPIPVVSAEKIALALLQIKTSQPQIGVEADENAVQAVRQILIHHPWARDIDVRSLFSTPSEFRQALAAYGVPDSEFDGFSLLAVDQALGSPVGKTPDQIQRYQDLNDYLFWRVAYYGHQGLGTGDSTYISARTYWQNRVNRRENAHTHHVSARPSVADIQGSSLKQAFESRAGLSSQPSFVFGPDGVAVYTDMGAILFTGSQNVARYNIKTLRDRERAPYARPQHRIAGQAEGSGLAQALRSVLARIARKRTRPPVSPHITYDEAQAAVYLSRILDGEGLSSDERQIILNLLPWVLQYEPEQYVLDGLLSSEPRGRKLEQILKELSTNRRKMTPEMAHTIIQIGDQLPALDMVAQSSKRFGHVSGRPIPLLESQIAFVMNEQNLLRALSLKEARQDLHRLRRERKNINPEQVLQSLRILAGIDRDDFFARVQRALNQQGFGYVNAFDVRDLLSGKRTDNAAMAVVLREFLLPNLLSSLVRQTGLAVEGELAKQLEKLEVHVVNPNEMPEAIVTEAGRLQNQIYIAVDESANPVDYLFEAVGLFAHEIGHLFVEGEHNTVKDEILAQWLASMALREMGLDPIATLTEIKTTERVAAQAREGKVLYLSYREIRQREGGSISRVAESLSSVVRQSRGLHNVVLLVDDTDIQQLNLKPQDVWACMKQGVRFVRVDDVSNIDGATSRSKLQEYALRNYGTARSKLAVNNGDIKTFETNYPRLYPLVLMGGKISRHLIETLGKGSLGEYITDLFDSWKHTRSQA